LRGREDDGQARPESPEPPRGGRSPLRLGGEGPRPPGHRRASRRREVHGARGHLVPPCGLPPARRQRNRPAAGPPDPSWRAPNVLGTTGGSRQAAGGHEPSRRSMTDAPTTSMTESERILNDAFARWSQQFATLGALRRMFDLGLEHATDAIREEHMRFAKDI